MYIIEVISRTYIHKNSYRHTVFPDVFTTTFTDIISYNKDMDFAIYILETADGEVIVNNYDVISMDIIGVANEEEIDE